MAHTQLISSNVAGLHYVHTLAAAYRRFTWINDPDYAHASDQEAWTKVRRDAVIAHAIARRQAAVAGLGWRIVPASQEPQDILAADLHRGLLEQIRRFWHARFNLAESIFRGSSYLYISGQPRVVQIRGDDRLRRWWVPEELPHVDRFRFRLERDPDSQAEDLRMRWTVFHLGTNTWVPLTRPEWFVRSVYANLEESLGYGRGLLQTIYFYWRAKAIVLEQGLEGLERWAQGLLKVAVDSMRPGSVGRDNASIASEYIDVLNRHRSQHILVHAKEDEIDVVSGPGQGWELVKFWLEYLDRGAERVCLSSQLPTGGGPSREGSFARADVEQTEMQQVFLQDQMVESEDVDSSLGSLTWTLNESTIQEVVRVRGLPPGRRGRFEVFDPIVEDPIKRAQSAQLLTSMGVPLLRREVYDRTGWTMPGEGEDVLDAVAGSRPGGVAPQVTGEEPGLEERLGAAHYGRGDPCEPGETEARTGCRPAAKTPGAAPGDGEAPEAPAAEVGRIRQMARHVAEEAKAIGAALRHPASIPGAIQAKLGSTIRAGAAELEAAGYGRRTALALATYSAALKVVPGVPGPTALILTATLGPAGYVLGLKAGIAEGFLAVAAAKYGRRAAAAALGALSRVGDRIRGSRRVA